MKEVKNEKSKELILGEVGYPPPQVDEYYEGVRNRPKVEQSCFGYCFYVF